MKNPAAAFFPSDGEFKEIGRGRTWKTSYLIVVSGTSLLAWLKSCLRSYSPSADIGMLTVSTIAMSISLLAVWSLVALLLYVISAFEAPLQKIRYKQILSLVSYCGIIFLIGELVNFVLMRIPILKQHLSAFPGRFPVGLDFFLTEGHLSLPAAIVMHTINPFVFWYCATLSLGMHSITGMSRMRSVTIVATMWMIVVGCIALVASALGGTTVGFRIG